jgi:hypothetical protein
METIRISKKELETAGGHFLWGLIGNKVMSGEWKEPFPTEIRFEFEQTSLAWRQEHGGPEILFMLEYLPWCLCDDVATLCARGYKIEIGEYSLS